MTRDGYDEAPIDPGARWNIEPCVAAPPAKWCRLTTPWNPLPLLVPITSTRSPGLKIDASTWSPGFSGSPPAFTFISRSTRVGGTAAFLKCPAIGLRRLRRPLLDEPELHGLVAVALRALGLHDDARAGLEHRHRGHRAVGAEHLRHPDLLADDSSHHISLA